MMLCVCHDEGVGKDGICFKELLTLKPQVTRNTPPEFEHIEHVKALVEKLFDGLDRWVPCMLSQETGGTGFLFVCAVSVCMLAKPAAAFFSWQL
jgi:hypothetical protein